MQNLYQLASKRYEQINVGLLNIDRNPHWSRMFVPRDTSMDRGEIMPEVISVKLSRVA